MSSTRDSRRQSVHSSAQPDANTAPLKGNNVEGNPNKFTQSYVARFTPRSRLSMKMQGIEAEDLVKKPFSSFRAKNEEVQKLRYSAFEMQRLETIQKVRETRMDIIENPVHNRLALKKMVEEAGVNNDEVSKMMEAMDERERFHEEEVIEKEHQKMEKILRRHEREIETMLQYESRVARISAVQTEKMAKREKLEAKRAKQFELERIEEEKKRRERLLQKQKQEIREAKVAEYRAHKEWLQEKKFRKERAEQEQKKLELAAKQQKIRDKKRIKLEIQQREFQEAKQQETEERSKVILAREKKRKQEIRLRREQKAKERQAANDITRKRVQVLLDRKEAEIEIKKKQFHVKMKEKIVRAERSQQEKELEQVQRLKIIQKKEIERKKRKKAAEQSLDNRITSILEKDETRGAVFDKIAEAHNHENMIRQEQERLNRQRKMLNVERIHRKRDFERELLLEKIHDQAMRTARLEEQRQRILQQRQENGIMLTSQKQEMLAAFEKLKRTRKWEKIAKQLLSDGQIKNQGGNGDKSKKSDALMFLKGPSNNSSIMPSLHQTQRSPGAVGNRKKKKSGMQKSASSYL